jgi:hypothetical protein
VTWAQFVTDKSGKTPEDIPKYNRDVNTERLSVERLRMEQMLSIARRQAVEEAALASVRRHDEAAEVRICH